MKELNSFSFYKRIITLCAVCPRTLVAFKTKKCLSHCCPLGIVLCALTRKCNIINHLKARPKFPIHLFLQFSCVVVALAWAAHEVSIYSRSGINLMLPSDSILRNVHRSSTALKEGRSLYSHRILNYVTSLL